MIAFRQIRIHGGGFLEEFANTIKCRIRGEGNAPNPAKVVPATRKNDNTLECETQGVSVENYDPEATFAVEITVDGGTCAYALRNPTPSLHAPRASHRPPTLG